MGSCRRTGVYLIALCGIAGAQSGSLWFDPAVISRCTPEGLGRAALYWNTLSDRSVQVRVFGVDGIPMTGWEPASGRTETGDWVPDGMLFSLVDMDGAVLAQARARVRCSGYAGEAPSELPAAGYLPLQAGNRWTYRANSRQYTAEYLTWQVEGTESINGQTWYVVAATDSASSVEYLRFRATPEGRIYTLERQTGGQWRERLRLNASSQPDPNSVFAVRSKGVPYRHALGTFTDTLLAWRFDGLIMDEIRFGNGVGILGRRQSLVAGSGPGTSFPAGTWCPQSWANGWCWPPQPPASRFSSGRET